MGSGIMVIVLSSSAVDRGFCLDWLINIFIAEQMMDGGWQPF